MAVNPKKLASLKARLQKRATPLRLDVNIYISLTPTNSEEWPAVLQWVTPSEFLNRFPEAVLYDGLVYPSVEDILGGHAYEYDILS